MKIYIIFAIIGPGIIIKKSCIFFLFSLPSPLFFRDLYSPGWPQNYQKSKKDDLDFWCSCLHLLSYGITGVFHRASFLLCGGANQRLVHSRQAFYQLSFIMFLKIYIKYFSISVLYNIIPKKRYYFNRKRNTSIS